MARQESVPYGGSQNAGMHDSTEWEKLYQAEASESILRDYAKTNSREYFADCFAYWVSYSGIEKHMEVFRNAAPQTYAYIGDFQRVISY